MQPTAPKQPCFLDQVRLVCRRSHFSPRTEEAYIFWIRRPYPLSEMGKTARRIQSLLGHRSLQTTISYTHILEIERTVTSLLDRLLT